LRLNFGNPQFVLFHAFTDGDLKVVFTLVSQEISGPSRCVFIELDELFVFGQDAEAAIIA